METVTSAAAAAVLATFCALIIKRTNGEMALVLELAVCAGALFASLRVAGSIAELLGRARELGEISGAVYAPVMKCVFIGIVSKCASDMCRDGGQSAMAGAVETAAAIGAVFVSLPLLSSLLDMLGELL